MARVFSSTHNALNLDFLYTAHTTPYEAAFGHLREMAPLEPEMWLSMSSKKVAWTPHRTRRFVVPLYHKVVENKTVQSYWIRHRFESLTLLQWLREVDHTKSPPKPYKTGLTFVATKCISVFRDEYFFKTFYLMYLTAI